MADLPGLYQLRQGTDGFLDRHGPVDAMQVEQIDVVDAQPRQACVAGARIVSGRLSDTNAAVRHSRDAALGGEEHLGTRGRGCMTRRTARSRRSGSWPPCRRWLMPARSPPAAWRAIPRRCACRTSPPGPCSRSPGRGQPLRRYLPRGRVQLHESPIHFGFPQAGIDTAHDHRLPRPLHHGPGGLTNFRDAQIAALKDPRTDAVASEPRESATTRSATAWRRRSSSCSASAAPI